MRSENVRVKEKLRDVLSKHARKFSGIFHADTPNEADRAFSNRPMEVINEFNELAFTVGKDKVEKTFVLDNWGLFESYPLRDGKVHDEKKWKAIGHVKENPRVKAIVTVIVYGQLSVGSKSYEILAITDALIKDTIEITCGYRPTIVMA